MKYKQARKIAAKALLKSRLFYSRQYLTNRFITNKFLSCILIMHLDKIINTLLDFKINKINEISVSPILYYDTMNCEEIEQFSIWFGIAIDTERSLPIYISTLKATTSPNYAFKEI